MQLILIKIKRFIPFKGTPEFTDYMNNLINAFKRDVGIFENIPITIPVPPIVTTTTRKLKAFENFQNV